LGNLTPGQHSELMELQEIVNSKLLPRLVEQHKEYLQKQVNLAVEAGDINTAMAERAKMKDADWFLKAAKEIVEDLISKQ
jgi:cytochrome c553